MKYKLKNGSVSNLIIKWLNEREFKEAVKWNSSRK